jgi:hypothetical protein
MGTVKKRRAPRPRKVKADLLLGKLVEALRDKPLTDSAYVARRQIAIARAKLVQVAIAQDLFSLEDQGEANDEAIGRAEALWLALSGARVPSAVETRAVVIAVREARRASANPKDAPSLAERVREAVEGLAPGALRWAPDAAIVDALTSADAKAGILRLLKAARLPSSRTQVDKYLSPRRR